MSDQRKYCLLENPPYLDEDLRRCSCPGCLEELKGRGATQPPSVTETAEKIVEEVTKVRNIEWTGTRKREKVESILTRLRASDAEELRRHKAALKVAKDALTKCAADIEFWSLRLDSEWSSFDGQLYPAMDKAKDALAAIDKELTKP